MSKLQGQVSRRDLLRYAAVGAGLGMSGLLAACAGGTGAPAKPAASGGQSGQSGQRNVSFLLDVAPYGKHAIFYVPLEKGYWREVGLNVAIESARGSGDNVTKLGSKAADIGFADTGAVIVGRANGANVKVVNMLHYKNLMMVVSTRRQNINQPRDIEGKTLSTTAADAGRVLLPAWAKLNNFDHERVNLITVDQPAKPGTIASGQAQGALDYYTAFPAYQTAARQIGDEATAIMYSDYGLDLYNNGIIVHDDTLRSDPDMVRRFLEALNRGVKYTVEHPDEANEIMLKHNPALTKETARAQLQICIDHLMVDEVRRNGIGLMSADKMQFTLDTVSQYYPLARPVTLDEIYTNDFVTKGVIPSV